MARVTQRQSWEENPPCSSIYPDYSLKVTPKSTPVPPRPPSGRAPLEALSWAAPVSLFVFRKWTLTRHLLVPTPHLSGGASGFLLGEALFVMAGTPSWHTAEAPRAHPMSPCRGGIKGGLCSRPSSRPTPELLKRCVHQQDNAGRPFPLPAVPAARPIRPRIKGAWVGAQAE